MDSSIAVSFDNTSLTTGSTGEKDDARPRSKANKAAALGAAYCIVSWGISTCGAAIQPEFVADRMTELLGTLHLHQKTENDPSAFNERLILPSAK
jgi:hypothetical protein